MDKAIHAERVMRNGEPITYSDTMSNLPDGAFILADGEPHAWWAGQLVVWTDRGYLPSGKEVTTDQEVAVLTPRSIVNALRSGYEPRVHRSITMNLTVSGG